MSQNNVEYFCELEHHDWFYAMSDDHQVWRKGQSAEERLRGLATTDAVKKQMWDSWCDWRSALMGGRDIARPQLGQFTEQAA